VRSLARSDRALSHTRTEIPRISSRFFRRRRRREFYSHSQTRDSRDDSARCPGKSPPGLIGREMRNFCDSSREMGNAAPLIRATWIAPHGRSRLNSHPANDRAGKVGGGRYERLPVAGRSLKAGAFRKRSLPRKCRFEARFGTSPERSSVQLRFGSLSFLSRRGAWNRRRNVSIPAAGEVASGRRRGGGRVAGATGRESSRKAKVYMRSPRVLTLSISRTCRFQIGIHISGQISRFTYPSGSVSFLNLALPSAQWRVRMRKFSLRSRSDPVQLRSLVSSSRVSSRGLPASHHVGCYIFSLGSPHRGPSWKRSSRRISRPVAQLTRKYCKLVPSTFAVLSPR
jgi:hypothetical protein